MGSSKETYIGVFLIVKGKLLSKIITEKVCLMHLEFDFEKTDKFCPYCGTALTERKRKVLEPSYFHDILFEIEYDDLFQEVNNTNEDMVWITNADGICSIDAEYVDFVEINEKMIKNYIENFKKNYKDALEILKERVVSFEIKFGVIVYYN